RDKGERFRDSPGVHRFERVFLIAPDQRLLIADEPAEDARAVSNRIARLGIDPPPDQIGDPAIRIRVAGRPHIRPRRTGRTVAAEEIEKLRLAEMRQLIEADEGELRPLPVELVLLMLQMREADRAAALELPGKLALLRRAANRAVKRE